MTQEEIDALKAEAQTARAQAKAALEQAESYKKAASDAETVNKTLQEQLVKAGQETKSDLPKLKIGNKTGVFAYATFKHEGKEMKAEEVIKAKDEELIKQLIESQVIIIQ